MKDQTQELLNQYSSYFKGGMSIEDLMEWIIYKFSKVWKNETPLILLDQEFDTAQFPNPESALNYRLINLEAARNVKSYLAIGNLAYSASKAAVVDLKKFDIGLNLIFESLDAFIQVKNENSILICFKNVYRFYSQNVSKVGHEHLTKYYPRIISASCSVQRILANEDDFMQVINIALDCLSFLLKVKFDLSLISKASEEINRKIIPDLQTENKKIIQTRLNLLQVNPKL